MKKLSRMESNKEVRRLLNRHGVDLAYCQYSCVGMEVHLTGWLCKHDGSEFSGTQVQTLIIDFQRLLHGYAVSGDFDNWNFTTERITYVGEKQQQTNNNDGGVQGEQITYEIDLDDFDFTKAS